MKIPSLDTAMQRRIQARTRRINKLTRLPGADLWATYVAQKGIVARRPNSHRSRARLADIAYALDLRGTNLSRNFNIALHDAVDRGDADAFMAIVEAWSRLSEWDRMLVQMIHGAGFLSYGRPCGPGDPSLLDDYNALVEGDREPADRRRTTFTGSAQVRRYLAKASR